MADMIPPATYLTPRHFEPSALRMRAGVANIRGRPTASEAVKIWQRHKRGMRKRGPLFCNQHGDRRNVPGRDQSEMRWPTLTAVALNASPDAGSKLKVLRSRQSKAGRYHAFSR